MDINTIATIIFGVVLTASLGGVFFRLGRLEGKLDTYIAQHDAIHRMRLTGNSQDE